ncbi:MAG: hypothetical protein JRI86_13500 [Deltaproteobacteria bacterium]|nr:hypothetical protein [Deltaproteobacteria bacterium]
MAELTLNEFSNISKEMMESKLMEEAYKMDISGAISSEKIPEKFGATMIPSTQDQKKGKPVLYYLKRQFRLLRIYIPSIFSKYPIF